MRFVRLTIGRKANRNGQCRNTDRSEHKPHQRPAQIYTRETISLLVLRFNPAVWPVLRFSQTSK
jgi:hypothetical protein